MNKDEDDWDVTTETDSYHLEQLFVPEDFVPEIPKEPDCDHTYKFVCHSGFRSELYRCTICGYEKSKRYYEWQR